MLLWTWIPEQLESTPPEILEEYTLVEEVNDLVDQTEYITKYQVWLELEKLLTLAPIKDRGNVRQYLITKLMPG